MPIFNGTGSADILQGSAQNDTINGLDGADLISGEGLDDSILGGGGNDTIYGDAGEGTAPGVIASPITLSYSNIRWGSETSSGNNNANVGDSIIYDDVAQLGDGTSISGRLIFVSTTNSSLNVDLSGGTGAEILMNSGSGRVPAGAEATFRLEFFDPATGDPIALNSTSTFNDLDRNGPGDQESVSIDQSSFTSYGTAADTSLSVTQSGGTVTAAGTEGNSPSDQDAWFSAAFENREFLEFTLEARSSPSGFTMSGDLIDDAVVTPIVDGNDTIDGGAGADVLFGQGGDDSLIAGAGNDSLDGGDGLDTLVAGSGDDTMSGGAGSDLFRIDEAGDHFIVGGEDADGSDVDVLDLSSVSARVTRTGDESGVVEFLDASGGVTNSMTYSEIEQVICFATGTLIATPRGPVPVERLQPGDRVITRDNGVQRLAWTGAKRLGLADLYAAPHLAPVTIKAHSIAPGVPDRDLTLSPNHRVLIQDKMARVLFNEAEVLVASKHLVSRPGISQSIKAPVGYHHIFFEDHQVVLSEGYWTESFQPGKMAMNGIENNQRDELLELFPELSTEVGQSAYGAARPELRRFEANLLFEGA